MLENHKLKEFEKECIVRLPEGSVRRQNASPHAVVFKFKLFCVLIFARLSLRLTRSSASTDKPPDALTEEISLNYRVHIWYGKARMVGYNLVKVA